MFSSWQQLRDLDTLHGESFYFLDINAFRDNYNEFIHAFRQIYAHSNIAYSYKTNYIPQICQYVQSQGGYAEVVSRMEYDLARHIGVPADRIIFNGPYKSRDDLELALCSGSIVNLDAMSEVMLVAKIMRAYPDRIMTVGVRCNFDVGNDAISRFGFDVDGEDLAATFQILGDLDNCVIGGLHCHYNTREKSLASYALRARRLLELSATYFPKRPPRYIDVGGGYFSKMSAELRKQFTLDIPTYQEYAQAIAAPLADAFAGASGPELIVEPGTALVADVLHFIAKVLDFKRVRSRSIALVSGSIHNIKPTLHAKNMPMQVVHRSDGIQVPQMEGMIDIVGYTCMEHDCLHTGYEGALEVGDYVWFPNVGAYTIVMKPPFIRPMPAIIEYDSRSGEMSLIKRPESGKDVFATYII